MYDASCRLARSDMREDALDIPWKYRTRARAFLRLIDQKVQWKSRAHFFGIAAQMMRWIRVDDAEAESMAERGAGAVRIELDEGLAAARNETSTTWLSMKRRSASQGLPPAKPNRRAEAFRLFFERRECRCWVFRPLPLNGSGPAHEPGSFTSGTHPRHDDMAATWIQVATLMKLSRCPPKTALVTLTMPVFSLNSVAM